MSDLASLNHKFDQLSELKDNIARAKARVKEAEDRYELLRLEVQQELLDHKMSSLKNDRYTVSVKHRDAVRIIDQNAVLAWLQKNKFNPAEYLTIDKTRIAPVLNHASFEDGEHVPGTEPTRTQFLEVKARKDTA